MNVSVCIEKRCPRCGGISQDDEPYCIQCGWVDYKPSGDWRVIGRPSGIYHLCISKRAGEENRNYGARLDPADSRRGRNS